ncbi:GrpB family protein [Candidatus Bipolaricaulota bacterium]|nr:GrpB family protein [Candidatus Bipolaricaulota bacterium]
MAREMRIVGYDPAWPDAYAEEAAAIRAALGTQLVRAHHIGSTAVSGLAAKPVIDICLEVRDLAQLDALDDAMRALGYAPRGEFGIPGRRYYPKGGDARTHHVHAFVTGDPHVEKHLAFRDYLRAHRAVLHEYAAIKAEASARYLDDPEGYQAHKHAFITQTLEDALIWAADSASRTNLAGSTNPAGSACPPNPP